MTAADDLAVLARVTASLVVVVALALLAARVARRAGRGGGTAGLRVVERTGLTREASVAVVEVGGRGLVVGVTAQGVTLLTELSAAELATAVAGPAVAAGDDVPPWGTSPLDLPTGTDLAGGGAGAGRIAVRRAPAARPARTQQRAGTGAVLDPRTWRQALETLRDLTARRP